MSQPNGPIPAEPAVPLAYFQAQTPAAEMIWIVRFLAAYLTASALLAVATDAYFVFEGNNFSLNQAVWFRWLFSATFARGVGEFCAAALVAAGLWHMRREAFWGLLLLPALRMPYLFMPSQVLLNGISALSSAIILAVISWTVYRRAVQRGILRPPSITAPVYAEPVADLRWFLGIVGIWLLTTVITRQANFAFGWWMGLFPRAYSLSLAWMIVVPTAGIYLIIRKTPRVLIVIAFVEIALTVGMDFVVWRDFNTSGGIARPWRPSPAAWANALMIAGFALALYRHASRTMRA